MKEKWIKLLTVKSLVTLALTGGYLYLSCDRVVPQEFQTIFTTVIAFYFGSQHEKKGGAK